MDKIKYSLENRKMLYLKGKIVSYNFQKPVDTPERRKETFLAVIRN